MIKTFVPPCFLVSRAGARVMLPFGDGKSRLPACQLQREVCSRAECQSIRHVSDSYTRLLSVEFSS
jgi:hypothetical protein